MDKVHASNLHVLAVAAYRLLKCGGIAKSSQKIQGSCGVRTYPPHNVKKWTGGFVSSLKKLMIRPSLNAGS